MNGSENIFIPTTKAETIRAYRMLELDFAEIKVELSAGILPQEKYHELCKKKFELQKKKALLLDQLERFKKWGSSFPNKEWADIEFDDDGIVLFRSLVELVQRGVLMTQLKPEDRELIEGCEAYLLGKFVSKEK